MHVIRINDSIRINTKFLDKFAQKSLITRLQKFKRLKTMLYMLGVNYNMEIEMNNNTAENSFNNLERDDVIKVRAIITCPSGDYQKKFRNQFPRKDLELMVVAFKIFDFMTCSKCGELLNLNLEFEI